ncbi:GH92 family glycosyl hydrolase [Spongiimicrobium sp. 3-5]|uniref:GH92 family glycosyl hydrolase n=1 Tax=Spongiimicrobium sp. 3-5 TaxID=3332596 RepID=UPI00397F2F37
MNMNRVLVSYGFIIFLFGACNSTVQQENYDSEAKSIYTDLVYPQLDTENSRWFFFTSASRPFGMVNLSPDTKLGGTWGSGYRYEIDTIKGFSHIHAWQLSGLSVMPVISKKEQKEAIFTDYYSKFDHNKEDVTPGYHSVVLQRYGIRAELTSTKRVGFHKYTFPKEEEAEILFNLNGPLGPCKIIDGVLEQTGTTTLSGQFTIAPTSRRPKANVVFFEATFDTPILGLDRDNKTGNYLLNLGQLNKAVKMKVAISYTSKENAKLNLVSELGHWDFNKVVQESRSEWNDLLGRIQVEGGTKTDRRRFYTDLWHAMQGRRTISDVNGAYPDNTGETFRIGQLPLTKDGKPAFNHYNSDAFWGAQWTINTLWGLAYPEIKKEFVQSLLQYGTDGGLIPRGPSGGNYTYVMTGASSTPFIVSAIQQGLITEDLEAIYQALKKNHMPGGIMEKSGYEHDTNLGGGLSHYLENGFVPYPIPEGKFGGHQDGASLTMEYAYQDWALAQLAKKLGLLADYEYFSKRGQNYKTVFDSASGWMRPKNVAGVWKEDFDPYLYENGFNESNGAQATWFVPHDIEGLAQLMGGSAMAVDKLNTQFEQAEKQGFTAGTSHDLEMHPENSRIPINYGNQPSIQTAFIFNKLNRPDLSQYWSHKVIKSAFSGLSPSTGYNGDEDQGLMGSLCVLMKIGLFQMTGGLEDDPVYQLGIPIFKKVTINLRNGKTIQISTDGNDQEQSLNEMEWNGSVLDVNELAHSQLNAGGTLKINKKDSLE